MDYKLKIHLEGKHDELKKMISVLKKYSEEGKMSCYFSEMTIQGTNKPIKKVPAKEMEVLLDSGTLEITANGPYGAYGNIGEIDIFTGLAKSAPDAKLEGDIYCSEKADSWMKASLDSSILTIDIKYDFVMDARTKWVSDYIRKVPRSKFKSAFKLEGAPLDDASYKKLITDLVDCYNKDGFINYEDFLDTISDYKLDSGMDDDMFAIACWTKVEKKGVLPYPKFEKTYEETDCEQRLYDALKKEYIK